VEVEALELVLEKEPAEVGGAFRVNFCRRKRLCLVAWHRRKLRPFFFSLT